MAHCELSGKGPVVKNLVSHSNIKTKKTAYLNIQRKSLHSQTLNEYITFRLAASTLRTIENKGSLDSYLLKQDAKKLSKRALLVRNRILRKLSKNTKKAAPTETPAPAAKVAKAPKAAKPAVKKAKTKKA